MKGSIGTALLLISFILLSSSCQKNAQTGLLSFCTGNPASLTSLKTTAAVVSAAGPVSLSAGYLSIKILGVCDTGGSWTEIIEYLPAKAKFAPGKIIRLTAFRTELREAEYSSLRLSLDRIAWVEYANSSGTTVTVNLINGPDSITVGPQGNQKSAVSCDDILFTALDGTLPAFDVTESAEMYLLLDAVITVQTADTANPEIAPGASWDLALTVRTTEGIGSAEDYAGGLF